MAPSGIGLSRAASRQQKTGCTRVGASQLRLARWVRLEMIVLLLSVVILRTESMNNPPARRPPIPPRRGLLKELGKLSPPPHGAEGEGKNNHDWDSWSGTVGHEDWSSSSRKTASLKKQPTREDERSVAVRSDTTLEQHHSAPQADQSLLQHFESDPFPAATSKESIPNDPFSSSPISEDLFKDGSDPFSRIPSPQEKSQSMPASRKSASLNEQAMKEGATSYAFGADKQARHHSAPQADTIFWPTKKNDPFSTSDESTSHPVGDLDPNDPFSPTSQVWSPGESSQQPFTDTNWAFTDTQPSANNWGGQEESLPSSSTTTTEEDILSIDPQKLGNEIKRICSSSDGWGPVFESSPCSPTSTTQEDSTDNPWASTEKRPTQSTSDDWAFQRPTTERSSRRSSVVTRSKHVSGPRPSISRKPSKKLEPTPQKDTEVSGESDETAALNSPSSVDPDTQIQELLQEVKSMAVGHDVWFKSFEDIAPNLFAQQDCLNAIRFINQCKLGFWNEHPLEHSAAKDCTEQLMDLCGNKSTNGQSKLTARSLGMLLEDASRFFLTNLEKPSLLVSFLTQLKGHASFRVLWTEFGVNSQETCSGKPEERGQVPTIRQVEWRIALSVLANKIHEKRSKADIEKMTEYLGISVKQEESKSSELAEQLLAFRIFEAWLSQKYPRVHDSQFRCRQGTHSPSDTLVDTRSALRTIQSVLQALGLPEEMETFLDALERFSSFYLGHYAQSPFCMPSMPDPAFDSIPEPDPFDGWLF